MFHAELTECVYCRRDNARRRAERAGLPYAFGSHRIHGRGRDGGVELEAREVDGARDRVVHERSREQLPVLAVDHFFNHRLADALRQAAVNLPFDDERVDEMSRIVDRH